jgi:hypothetical protein
MARANNGGWDFVKVGGVYQYKEEGQIAIVKVLSTEPDPNYYRFQLSVLAATFPFDKEFEVVHHKNPGGYWNEMQQFYPDPEYSAKYKHVYDKEAFESSKFFPQSMMKGIIEDGNKS